MVAQEAVISTLRNQVMSGRVAMRTSSAAAAARAKHPPRKSLRAPSTAEHPVGGDPCGQCESCRRLLADESMDVMEIDAASNNGVEEIRNLRETVKYPPQQGKYKVYIIDEVHMLSTAAFMRCSRPWRNPPPTLSLSWLLPRSKRSRPPSSPVVSGMILPASARRILRPGCSISPDRNSCS